MANRMKQAVKTLPKAVECDREAIRLLREERAVVHFDCPEFDAYVKAPDGVIREFTMLYTTSHDYTDTRDPDRRAEWQQTSIDPFTLKRELRRREFSIEADARTPFSDR